jgi:hypothetical protein
MTPDSGTSLMAVPTWAYDTLIDKLPFKEDCDSKYGFGTLTFVIDGVKYPLASEHFMDVFTNVFEPDDKICMSIFTHIDVHYNKFESLWIIGDAFM